MSHQQSLDEIIAEALRLGCPPDQLANYTRAGLILQPRQYAASAAARLCDLPGGPTMIGFGGARCGGKSHWLLAQVAADDCQRYPGLKVLLLRKSGKANREAFEDLRLRLFTNLKHTYSASTGVLIFDNGSRIFIKHYQHENEINNSYLGLEYDVIAIEEATTLTERKVEDIKTCCRTSKSGWRPRIYSTTNPGGVGHDWYYRTFIVPWQTQAETKTRFIQALVQDNKFANPDYEQVLAELTGWRKAAWCDGNWHIESGQFFKTFNHRIHVVSNFNDADAVEWFAAMDYGYTHYTVFLLSCLDINGNLWIVDEHAERGWIPKRHLQAIKDMLLRHRLLVGRPNSQIIGESMKMRMRFDPPCSWRLSHIAVGSDLFARQYDGSTIAAQFRDLGAALCPANTNRVQGWAEILDRLGDPASGVPPTLFFHERCKRLIATLPYLQHDPDHPADVLKADTNDEGLGGDDSADALRYLIATRVPKIYARKLTGV
jgi:hypothetical protein